MTKFRIIEKGVGVGRFVPIRPFVQRLDVDGWEDVGYEYTMKEAEEFKAWLEKPVHGYYKNKYLAILQKEKEEKLKAKNLRLVEE